jgi:uncharacterized membrane protein
MPNTGVLILVPPEKVTDLAMPTADAIRLITSAGVVSPEIGLGEAPAI